MARADFAVSVFVSLLVMASTALAVQSAAPPHAAHPPHAVAYDWQPQIRKATFPLGDQPTVMVDAGHGNWHTISGRFAPFARLLRADGYRVEEASGPLTAELLSKTDIFVIANAVLGGEESKWVLPTPHAFTDAEVKAVTDWVANGGSLMLIADHMPFPGSTENLAAAFGIGFIDGYAKPGFDQSGTFVFPRATGLLSDHPITRGRSPTERVSSVKSFTGQGFRLFVPAQVLMTLPSGWHVYLPQDGLADLRPDTPRISARGLVQGAVLLHGRGRVAVFGEAAMFTAQTQVRDGKTTRNGMADPEASENAQFTLNVMHWLSGLIDSLPPHPAK